MNTSNFQPLLAVVLILLALPFGASLLLGDDPAKTDLSVQGLRCEYLSNPLGVEVRQPRLSWRLGPAPDVRGQSGYRVLVASTPALLQKDQGDLWDSGHIASEQSTWVEYG